MHKFVFIVMMVIFSLPIASAQDDVSPELQAQLDEIELQTSNIRQLDRLESTTLDFPSTDELEVFLREEFDESYSPEEFADDQLFYIGLDLFEGEVDLEAVLFDFLLSQIAGFYDPETDMMNVILMSGDVPEDSLPILEEITYSHEYIHALQDQHFDLEALLDEVDASENGDFQLAVLSLVEGDATQAMTDYTVILAEEDPLALAQAIFSAGADLGGVAIPEGVPAIIEEELLFPYIQGQVFVAAVINAGGWDAIDEAFAGNLPLSTEHIYHPERYLTGEKPIKITIPDISDLLGDNWRLAHDTNVGEFYLRQYLGTQLGSRQVADMATGWGGDHMLLYVDDATGEILWVLHQVWDTPEDATEFVAGYTEFLNLRFADGQSDGICWSSADAVCFIQANDTETHIVYAPDTALAFALLRIDT